MYNWQRDLEKEGGTQRDEAYRTSFPARGELIPGRVSPD